MKEAILATPPTKIKPDMIANTIPTISGFKWKADSKAVPIELA